MALKTKVIYANCFPCPTVRCLSDCRRSLKKRLAAGETILCAEGYLLAFVRAGYVLQGLWVPAFVLDYPEVLRQQHYEFVRAGSDVTEAYQVQSR